MLGEWKAQRFNRLLFLVSLLSVPVLVFLPDLSAVAYA